MELRKIFPCLGAAYYPEDWEESEIKSDIAKAKNRHIRCKNRGICMAQDGTTTRKI